MEVSSVMTIFDSLERLDQTMTLSINSLNSPISDFIWTIFSNKEIWFILYGIVLVFFFLRFGWKKAIIITLSCILTVVACDQFGNFTKDYFERLRPCWDGYMVAHGLHLIEGRGNLYGFYSAHAANAIGFAVCSYLNFRNDKLHTYHKYSLFICLWAILVGVSRIFVGKHFLGDVLTGFFFGWLFALIFSKLANLIIRKCRL